MQFDLKGELSELETLSGAIARFCEANRLASDVEFDLNLVLEELFTNTLKHGGANGMAHVEIKLDGGDVVVLFADRGIEFNPLQAPSPDLRLPLGQRTAGGLGIHLVRQVMRNLTYERVEGWNRITMRRTLL